MQDLRLVGIVVVSTRTYSRRAEPMVAEHEVMMRFRALHQGGIRAANMNYAL